MLRKNFLIVILFLIPLTLSAQVKFGHLNCLDVMKAMPEYQQAEATIDVMQKKYQEELMRTQYNFQLQYQEYLSQANSLPKNIAERRQKELQDMAQRQEQFQQESYKAIQEAREQALAPIKQKLADAILNVGLEGEFTYIFDISKTDIPFIGEASYDVTEAVKSKLEIK